MKQRCSVVFSLIWCGSEEKFHANSSHSQALYSAHNLFERRLNVITWAEFGKRVFLLLIHFVMKVFTTAANVAFKFWFWISFNVEIRKLHRDSKHEICAVWIKFYMKTFEEFFVNVHEVYFIYRIMYLIFPWLSADAISIQIT